MGSTDLDLRLIGVALAAWVGVVAGVRLAGAGPPPHSAELLAGPGRSPVVTATAVVAIGSVAAICGRRLATGRRPTALAWGLVLLAALGCGLVRGAVARSNPVAILAADGAVVRVEAELTAVPTPIRTGVGVPGSVLVRLRIHRLDGVRPAPGLPLTDVVARGVVSARAGPAWSAIPVGEHVRVLIRLQPAPPGRGVDAWGQIAGTPVPTAGPGRVDRTVDRLRDGLLVACRRLPQPARGLIPAVVDGDTRLVGADTTSDMKVSGLLHLSAVSGANVAVVLAATTGLAGALRCGRVLTTASALVVLAGFVLVADSAPSVVRAGVTAALGLLGARQGGRGTGVRVLATAAAVLVVADPGLGRDAGFGLSVCATAAILLGSGRLSTALGGWLPPPVAAAVGVSIAAQLGAQPILGLLSGQLSVVGPLANVLAAPAVPPVTLLGLAAGLLQPVAPWAASLAAAAAVPGAWWLAELAHTCARLPGAALGWPAGAVGALLALGVAAVGLWVGPSVLRHRGTVLAGVGALVGFVLGPFVP